MSQRLTQIDLLALPSINNPASGYVAIGAKSDGLYQIVGTTLSKLSLDGHKHVKANITDFPTSMPASDVSAWAKAATKPTYTASEVGALAVGANAVSATKLQTARTISITGGATGTATAFDGSANISIPVTSLDPWEIANGYTAPSRTYVNTHPENQGWIIPFVNNDLAFLTNRGGAMTSYKTTDTDYSAVSLTNSGAVPISTTAPFDGSASYASYSVAATTDVVIIDITCPTTFAYSTNFYIDFGASPWRAKTVSIYAFNSSGDNSQQYYKLMGATTNQTPSQFACFSSYSFVRTSDGGTTQGFNKLRFVLTNFINTIPRIACLGIINFSSAGLKETFISRGGSSIYGNFYPYSNNALSLGLPGNKWANVYATTFNGSLTGNASSATKLQTSRTIWGQSFDGTGNIEGALTQVTTIEASGTISATTGIFSNLSANYLPKHTASGLTNSIIYDNGTNVSIGTTAENQKLNVFGNVHLGNGTTGSLISDKEMIVKQVGDTYGESILRLQNRSGCNGAMFETTNTATTLVDFVFKNYLHQRNIRLESRSASAKCGSPSFHIGGLTPDTCTLAVGDSYAAVANRLMVGSYAEPACALEVIGDARVSGELTTPAVNFGNDWTIEASGSDLIFYNAGSEKARLTTNGFTSKGEITAFV